MLFRYQETLPFDGLDDPYPNSVLHGLDREFVKEILRVDDPEPVSRSKPGFWRRQFSCEVTSGQRKFDWMFGVIMPAVCIGFDPIVFTGMNGGDGLLTSIKPFAYLLSFTAIMAMAAWLLWGDKLRGLAGALAGFFAVAGVLALAIGIFLLPFSLFGLFIVIGALGFTPLFTSTVFLRNSARAYHSAKEFIDPSVLQHLAAVSALFSAVVTYVFQSEIRKVLAFIAAIF